MASHRFVTGRLNGRAWQKRYHFKIRLPKKAATTAVSQTTRYLLILRWFLPAPSLFGENTRSGHLKVWKVIECVAKVLPYRGKLTSQELDYLLSIVGSPGQQAPLDFLGVQTDSGLIDLEDSDKCEGETPARTVRSSAPSIFWPMRSDLPFS